MLSLAGCASSGPAQAVVDADKARETLRAVLESWKGGQPHDAPLKQDPPILVQDIDWIQGMKLADFAVAGDGETDHGVLVIPVTLKLTGARGRMLEKAVRYQVTTSPSLTVMRDVM